jgi:hypothetical protein
MDYVPQENLEATRELLATFHEVRTSLEELCAINREICGAERRFEDRRMVEISMSGSGEGPGGVTSPGYSTNRQSAFPRCCKPSSPSDSWSKSRSVHTRSNLIATRSGCC